MPACSQHNRDIYTTHILCIPNGMEPLGTKQSGRGDHATYIEHGVCLHLYDVWVCLCMCVWVSVYACMHLFDVCVSSI